MTQPRKPASVGGAIVGALGLVLGALLVVPLLLAGLVGGVYLILWSVRTFGALGLVFLILGSTLVVVFGTTYHTLRHPSGNARRRRTSSTSSGRSSNSGSGGRWLALGFLLGRRRGN